MLINRPDSAARITRLDPLKNPNQSCTTFLLRSLTTTTVFRGSSVSDVRQVLMRVVGAASCGIDSNMARVPS
jgi:hypothetical protein